MSCLLKHFTCIKHHSQDWSCLCQCQSCKSWRFSIMGAFHNARCYANVLVEHRWISSHDYTLSDGFSSFISNILWNKQSSLLWHFFRMAKLSAIHSSWTLCFSFMCMPVEDLMRWWPRRLNPYTSTWHLSNRLQVSMVYRLINHVGCW